MEKFVINVVSEHFNMLPMQCTHKLYNTKEEAIDAICKEIATSFPKSANNFFSDAETLHFEVKKFNTIFSYFVYITAIEI